MGVILSMLVLFIFFGDGKAAIVGSAMPISLLVTVIVMAVAGFSLNIITLGALVIAIGMMVDSSSVVLESCFRAKDKKPGFREAAEIGTRGVAGSIVASTMIHSRGIPAPVYPDRTDRTDLRTAGLYDYHRHAGVPDFRADSGSPVLLYL